MSKSLFVGCVLLVGMIIACPAQGAVIHVSTTGNDNEGDGSEGLPYRSIQRGINAARTGDTVEAAEGTYVENIDFRGKRITVASADPADPAVVDATVIDGNQAGSVVRFARGESAKSVLTGFTIRNGLADEGGGIYCRGSSPTIAKNIIRDNTAVSAVYYGGGGGICCRGGKATISECTFTGNTGGMGGAVGCFAGATTTILNCAFVENTAERGGGAICFLQASGSVSGSLVADNTTNDWDGGGILLQWGCVVSITECTIADNVANGGGGIAMNEALSQSRMPVGIVTRCTITGNKARFVTGGGGGVSVLQGIGFLVQNLICGNQSRQNGAGVQCRTGAVIVYNCTVAQNVSLGGYGGGISAGDQAMALVNGCIVRDNTAVLGPQLAAYGVPVDRAVMTVAYSNVEGGDAAAHDETGEDLWWTFANTDADPLFASPGHWDDNSTPGDYTDDFWVDGDYHLLSAAGRWDPAANAGFGGWVADAAYSPCIDAGDPALGSVDEPLPNGSRFNMGAYGGTPFASKSPSYGDDDIVRMTVTSSHDKDGDEAVWPDKSMCPYFFWISNIDVPAYFLVDVSTDPAVPLPDTKATLVLGKPKITSNGYEPTRAEWKKLKKLAARGGGTLYWRVRAFDESKALIYTTAALKLVIDEGEWTLDDLDLDVQPSEVSWTHEGMGIERYRVQFSVDENFPPSARYTLTLPPSRTGSSYTLSAAMARRLLAFASRNGATTLYYRIRGEDADRAFVAYSDAKTAAVP